MMVFLGVIATFTMLVAIVEKSETQKSAKHCFIASVAAIAAIQIAEIIKTIVG